MKDLKGKYDSYVKHFVTYKDFIKQINSQRELIRMRTELILAASIASIVFSLIALAITIVSLI